MVTQGTLLEAVQLQFVPADTVTVLELPSDAKDLLVGEMEYVQGAS